MQTVNVIFENGDSLVTSINGTAAEIRRYYVGNLFNLGTGGRDLMTRAVLVVFMDIETVSPERAGAIVAECIRTAGCGPWSDRLRSVMTAGEIRYITDHWQAMTGNPAFVDAVLQIWNARRTVADDGRNDFDEQYTLADAAREGDGPYYEND